MMEMLISVDEAHKNLELNYQQHTCCMRVYNIELNIIQRNGIISFDARLKLERIQYYRCTYEVIKSIVKSQLTQITFDYEDDYR